ncbi:putative cuticle protein [Danaus plexippus plexippus]|uniref:Cuticle protein n=1 Tax=Danaus plexippus plexippus TaxID=278856 RepID=A0A212FGR4_DANPL|nr:putative cuticle protein [Danaus plexippus plexippus]
MNLFMLLACIIATTTATNSTETTTNPPNNTTQEILKASETADPTKAEIVKQIRRLNEDGSYTIGYEANDGTFKIESRDVLGNVKGTFGYVSDDGEIKRVTYSSSADSTPASVTTSTTPTTPTMVVRVNKTISSTTRRPLATVVYPTRGSTTTRGTVIQAIPRRRTGSSSVRPQTTDTTTETQKQITASSSNVHRREDLLKSRSQSAKTAPVTSKDDLLTKQTTSTASQTLKPVYEHTTERETDINKSTATRRELSGASANHHMLNLQQSMGDDSTDVYGIVHISAQRGSDKIFYQPQYRRPAAVLFRTQEYLRDNPGAPIPIGNQRPFLNYEYPDKILDSQYVKESQQVNNNQEAESGPYEYRHNDYRPAPRIIHVPVDDRGVPIQGYEARYVNPYRPQPLIQRYDPVNEMHSISAPVSTRDFKRLLHILILRQNRLQALMEQIMPEAYQAAHYRSEPYHAQSRPYSRHRDDDQYDYRYQPQYRQDFYSTQVSNYDDRDYESHRYSPRRRLYSRPYDAQGSASEHIEQTPEYLPVEVREALLLKMLLLAISPDFMPTPAPATELTTAAPTRKQVRNVQILGEEGSDKKTRQGH